MKKGWFTFTKQIRQALAQLRGNRPDGSSTRQTQKQDVVVPSTPLDEMDFDKAGRPAQARPFLDRLDDGLHTGLEEVRSRLERGVQKYLPPPPPPPRTSQAPQNELDHLFNWIFGLSQAHGLVRRTVLIGMAACAWALAAFYINPPAWGRAEALVMLFYPLKALSVPPVCLPFMLAALMMGVAIKVIERRARARGDDLRFIRMAYGMIAFALGVGWALLGYKLVPPDFANQFVVNFIAYPFEALFAPLVLHLVIAVAMGFWLAYQVAASYLDDIYELQNLRLSERFLLQTIFSSGFNLINIKGGDVAPEDRSTPVIRVGGPGKVEIHLENAALFESVDGTPRVLPDLQTPPKRRKKHTELLGFERLRQVFELSDQSGVIPQVEGRTRDGIRLRAQDMHMVYSIDRGQTEPSLEHPYPFNPQAIERVVYDQSAGDWKKATEGMLRTHMQKFIGNYNLSELWLPVLYNDSLGAAQSETRTGLANTTSTPAPMLKVTQFAADEQITERFKQSFAQKASASGLKLSQVSKGSWMLPDGASLMISSQNLEAWKISHENALRSHPADLQKLEDNSFYAEMLRLLQEILGLYARREQDATPYELAVSVGQYYQGLLGEMLQNCQTTRAQILQQIQKIWDEIRTLNRSGKVEDQRRVQELGIELKKLRRQLERLKQEEKSLDQRLEEFQSMLPKAK